MSATREIDFASAGGEAAASQPKVRAFASLCALAGAAVRRLARALLNRRSAGRLRDLDDWMLDDIGLTRHDLERALTVTGRFEDPTPGLSRAARARAGRRMANGHR